MDKYKCGICGKRHNIYTRFNGFEPKLLTEIPEKELENRVKEWGDFLYIDTKYVLRKGYLFIYMEEVEEPYLIFEVWGSISPKEFLSKLEDLKSGKVVEYEGKLESEILFFDNSIGLPINFKMQLSDGEILTDIKVIGECQLKRDQERPITKERLIEFMQKMHHRNLDKERPTEAFQERLIKILNEAESKYLERNKTFSISVLTNNEVLFQIVNNYLLEESNKDLVGYGIHLPFDQSIEEETNYLNKFKKSEYSKEFQYQYLDEIPTFQKDIGLNKKILIELIEKISKEVYGIEKNEIWFDLEEL